IIGGTIFGLGWALIGACPGPLYILLGTGVLSMAVVIAAAMLGTFVYGILKNKLPH
ncbi:MAG TPA: YeeE/YedE thiosulfate transporter family protein, partial [Mariniflexile sp.]|nr:YeeE/YedE thiosulfate transporter family protein [Mariniflexile sp.]